MLNWPTLRTPDSRLGKILLTARAVLELGVCVVRRPSRRTLRLASFIWRLVPNYTMVSPIRLVALYELVQRVVAAEVPGDIVECGTWNGGSAALMGVASRDTPCRRGRMKRLWLFDSFQGLPQPSERDEAQVREAFFEGWCQGDPRKVETILTIMGIPLTDVTIVPGWFQDTLPRAKVSKIALLYIDSDWYDSVKLALETFYLKVAPGGLVVIDDYHMWKGCRRAVEDYLQGQRVDAIAMHRFDGPLAFWQKPTVPSPAGS